MSSWASEDGGAQSKAEAWTSVRWAQGLSEKAKDSSSPQRERIEGCCSYKKPGFAALCLELVNFVWPFRLAKLQSTGPLNESGRCPKSYLGDLNEARSPAPG